MHAPLRGPVVSPIFRRYLLPGGVAAGGLVERFHFLPRGRRRRLAGLGWSGTGGVPDR